MSWFLQCHGSGTSHVFVDVSLGSGRRTEEDVFGLGRQVLADDLLRPAKNELEMNLNDKLCFEKERKLRKRKKEQTGNKFK